MLPRLNKDGDLPPGVHVASWDEVAERFGVGAEVRTRAAARIWHIHELAARTGKLRRFYIFGSFVSAAPEPRDVDVALVMVADFKLEESPRECRTLFLHADAQARHGASIFWLREGMLPEALAQSFLETLQIRRDGAKRGIVELQL